MTDTSPAPTEWFYRWVEFTFGERTHGVCAWFEHTLPPMLATPLTRDAWRALCDEWDARADQLARESAEKHFLPGLAIEKDSNWQFSGVFSLPYSSTPYCGGAPREALAGSFCFTPHECKNRSSCPRPYACSE